MCGVTITGSLRETREGKGLIVRLCHIDASQEPSIGGEVLIGRQYFGERRGRRVSIQEDGIAEHPTALFFRQRLVVLSHLVADANTLDLVVLIVDPFQGSQLQAAHERTLPSALDGGGELLLGFRQVLALNDQPMAPHGMRVWVGGIDSQGLAIVFFDGKVKDTVAPPEKIGPTDVRQEVGLTHAA